MRTTRWRSASASSPKGSSRRRSARPPSGREPARLRLTTMATHRISETSRQAARLIGVAASGLGLSTPPAGDLPLGRLDPRDLRHRHWDRGREDGSRGRHRKQRAQDGPPVAVSSPPSAAWMTTRVVPRSGSGRPSCLTMPCSGSPPGHCRSTTRWLPIGTALPFTTSPRRLPVSGSSRVGCAGAAIAAAQDADLLVCEGVGGFLGPVDPDYLVRDLARDLALPVVIVSARGLGTINHTLLTIEAVRNAAWTSRRWCSTMAGRATADGALEPGDDPAPRGGRGRDAATPRPDLARKLAAVPPSEPDRRLKAA